ncbi:putative PAS/PAC sensor protein [Desulforamulus reducens MI-1]|uniref:Putative PAS/PAC sensor protein n=1 Tax=Desulforamulus reducens (strain ATCC BAA-1160 / DSM 100696 / MI-1) TaxID=349161 RepID=A4J7W3_DESRM|nr:DUF438 domain-containing protein [Desulforamulus reducens]ABO51166.1 putative PAS/PAC sensor protein [Desulforamulus reducens MI-1]
MSEYLGNKEAKQQMLKTIIKDLHQGKDFNQVKADFQNLIKDIDASEIANMEQALIGEGMNPEEITKLCDVHAAVFRDALEENEKPNLILGHPMYTIKHENEEIKKALEELDNYFSSNQMDAFKDRLSFFRDNLDRHYSKKENILFPYLERHNITGPPSVMWSVDDEIRDMGKILLTRVKEGDAGAIKTAYETMKNKISEMIFKEENILTPMLLETLTEEEWAEIKQEDEEFGVVFSKPHGNFWQPKAVTTKNISFEPTGEALSLDTGFLTLEQINTILTNIPIDITFVDKDDTVRYFSQGRERIFVRTKSIIGRKVQNCHPPDSVHMVEKILSDFKHGKHSTAEFWLELAEKFIHIRYFALRDEQGHYVGTMEVSQDVTGIRSLEGERRLLQYED